MTGDRHNVGKPQISMMLEARNAVEGCSKVLTFGAQKYSRGNWLKGLPTEEIVDSMMRHLTAYMSGELNDPETGMPHVDHVMCNALFLSEMQARKVNRDAERAKNKEEARSDSFQKD